MTTHTDEILVLGGTGKTGRRLVHALRATGHAVRAASRSGETRFDWTDRHTWAAALDGATAVYLVAPEDPALADVFVEQATEAGVRRFVALSARGIGDLPADVFQGMAAAERAVRTSGVAWTILQPNNFSQNFSEDMWHAPLLSGRLALPVGSAPEPFVDARDIADVAAALLTSDRHQGRTFVLSGPRAVTFTTAVATIAEASGRAMRYAEITPEEFRDLVLAAGWPEAAATELNAMYAAMRSGAWAEPGDGVQRVLGREPIDFATYAAGAATAGAWS
ncbi:NAD(P)H-binding protein [Streptomyces hainanensis]|uniref:NAD-dependent epimerase/dehydratase family protein n=1 Tax=Streptomyces hainanensis TaxID=402648 RepID=A0A4V2Y3D8_9ACTN|nr:NAD(P)H-binding protein [Streptomyces hainanensis]TDC76165.1 NAD-dependent epimerase/dehydratase family protein [Streptomyces hainanensis]